MNNKICYICHNVYWPYIKEESMNIGYISNTFDNISSLDEYKNSYDIIVLFSINKFDINKIKKIEEIAKKTSKEEDKKVTIAYAYKIPICERNDENTEEIQIASFYNDEEERYIEKVNDEFDKIDLLHHSVDYHNKNEKMSFAIYIKRKLNSLGMN